MSQDHEINLSDEQFYERVDEFIEVANQFMDSTDPISGANIAPGQVSASFMYANTRFSTWLSACAYDNVQDFKQDRHVILEYYQAQFKAMLEDHLDEYTENFDAYFPRSDEDEVKHFV